MPNKHFEQAKLLFAANSFKIEVKETSYKTPVDVDALDLKIRAMVLVERSIVQRKPEILQTDIVDDTVTVSADFVIITRKQANTLLKLLKQ